MATSKEFRCLLVEQEGEGTKATICQLPADRLPEGEVTIEVKYSSLNFKDALAVSGHRGIIKRLPHIPGIDAAGTVIDEGSTSLQKGDRVIVTGYDLGQGHWGGWSERIRVPAEWVVPLPDGLSLQESMILGTAGFTAAQCVMALRRNEIMPETGRIVVTGATGGVGSLAVRLLGTLGYDVVAVTGKQQHHQQLKSVGAGVVIGRDGLKDNGERPMLSLQQLGVEWSGAVDTVGGQALSTLIRSAPYGACITACGLVAGADLPLTVYPFLLRGVTLSGIASADCPRGRREEIWQLLAGDWKPQHLDSMLTICSLEEVSDAVKKIERGEICGRVLVEI